MGVLPALTLPPADGGGGGTYGLLKPGTTTLPAPLAVDMASTSTSATDDTNCGDSTSNDDAPDAARASNGVVARSTAVRSEDMRTETVRSRDAEKLLYCVVDRMETVVPTGAAATSNAVSAMYLAVSVTAGGADVDSDSRTTAERNTAVCCSRRFNEEQAK